MNSRVQLQNSATGTGNGTAVNVAALTTASVQVSGTFSGAITFEGTVDLTNWVSVQLMNVSDGSVSTTATAAGIYSGTIGGLVQFRARISAYTSGTITATGYFTDREVSQVINDVQLDASSINKLAGLVNVEYDAILPQWSGSTLTGVLYKTGGESGTTVATVTISYSGTNITAVVKT